MILILIFMLVPLWQPLSVAEHESTYQELIQQIEDPDPARSWEAVLALGEKGDRRAVPHLIKALERDMRARQGTAMAIIPTLGLLQDERAVPALARALMKPDEDWLGRAPAAKALGDIGSAKAVPSLIHAAWLPETRNAAISALAAIGDPRAVDALFSAVNMEELPEVRQAAIDGLISIGRPAVPCLISKLESTHKACAFGRKRAMAAGMLGKIGDMRAEKPLNRALSDLCPEVRKHAGKALADLLQ